jgi:nucleoside-diphosphate-sugar epimerase
MDSKLNIIGPEDLILVTGAAGYIGPKVLENLLNRGFRNLRCLVRPSSNISKLETVISKQGVDKQVSICIGNLLSRKTVSRQRGCESHIPSSSRNRHKIIS